MNLRKRLDELVVEQDIEVIIADGFDDALIGVTEIFCHKDSCHKTHAVYSRQKCIESLMDNDGMDESEASEYFDFNVQGAIIKGGPIFIDL